MSNLNYITKREYTKKMNDTIIDGKQDKDKRITINKFLNSQRRPTRVYLDSNKPRQISNRNYIHDNNFLRVYDHMKDFRLLIPGWNSPNSLLCTFSSPYNSIDKLKQYVQEPWIDNDYKIYLVNPRLYRYYNKNTVTLAHVKNIDGKYSSGDTNWFINIINTQMIKVTGETLFYLI